MSTSTGTELLVDGSFEKGIVGAKSWSHQKTVGGWKSDTEIEVWGKDFYGVKATNGDKIAELDYDGKASNIYQDIKTEAGAEYTFSFDYSKRPDSKSGSDTVEIFWNGKLIGTVDPNKTDWSRAEFKVIGTGGDDRIEFRESSGDNDSYGGLLDNASLTLSKPAPNNDDDKHDGRGHGDGDHNDDGHSDNGKGSSKHGKGHDDHGKGKGHDDHGKGKGKGHDHDDDDDHDGDDDGSTGGTGKPTLTLKTVDVTDVITGTTLTGTGKTDAVNGGKGNDTVLGKGGDDTLTGDGDGMFTVKLDIAADFSGDQSKLSFTIGNLPKGAILSAGTDNGDGTWTLTAADLKDLTMTASDVGDFTLTVDVTTTTAPKLTATSKINVTLGDGDADEIQGNGGSDTIDGGAGDDVLYGGTKPSGTTTTPHVSTVADNDVVHGGTGNDKVWGNSGDDLLTGDEGNDFVSGGKGNDTVEGGIGDDTLAGNSGDDVLADGDGTDIVNGNSGNDTVLAGEGDDTYIGGSGFDTIDFSGATSGMKIDLSKSTALGMGLDSLKGFEAVIGSSHDDMMTGSKNAEVMIGGDGDDVLRGLGGADTLTGGAGDDTFVFLKKDMTGGVDHVTDFNVGDKLDLSDFLKGGGAVEDVLSVSFDGKDTHVFAIVAGKSVEVAVLDGFNGQSAHDMLANGMLLT